MKKTILSSLVLFLALSAAAQHYDVTFTGLLDEMSDPSSHAKWPVNEYVCRQSSSYSRESVTPATAAEDSRFRPESGRDWGKGWFANHDFNNYIREETTGGQTEYVMHEDYYRYAYCRPQPFSFPSLRRRNA